MPAPKIKIKRSSVAGKVPHYPNTLDLGEFAINTADGKVFIAAGVNGVGVGTTVREVGISTENLLSQSLRVDGDTDLNGDLSVSDVASFNHAKFVGVLTSTSFHGNINSTGISTIAGFRFPSTDGSEDQALVTDGSGSLSFKTLSGGGGGFGPLSRSGFECSPSAFDQNKSIFGLPSDTLSQKMCFRVGRLHFFN